jgi:RimJ/RimL family protein N-acetyltransferase
MNENAGGYRQELREERGSQAACVPVIETRRLILRAASRRHFPTYLAMMSDESSPRTTTENIWRKFTSAAGLWVMLCHYLATYRDAPIILFERHLRSSRIPV